MGRQEWHPKFYAWTTQESLKQPLTPNLDILHFIFVFVTFSSARISFSENPLIILQGLC